jgi:PERQ amino acid-rich with GYF domain-containing protein
MNFQTRESNNTAQNRTSVEGAGVYIPPHRNGATSEGSRYSKEQLLELYRREVDAGSLRNGTSNLFMNGWEPNATNGTTSASWGRRDDQRDGAVGADVCWNTEGNALPISLTDMTADEREVRSSLIFFHPLI